MDLPPSEDLRPAEEPQPRRQPEVTCWDIMT
jgi:hypothetical protein